MCKISSDIKLCTCNKNLGPEDHIWRLRSYSEPKVDYMGEIMAPEYSAKELAHGNLDLLLQQLNSKQMFDFNYVPKNKDMLEIRICIDVAKKEYLRYRFYYEKGWTDIQPAMEIRPKKIKTQGTIKNAME